MTTPEGRATPRRRVPTIHPVLFALLPVLLLYTGNLSDLTLHDLLCSAAPVAAASLPVWWLCVRLFRDRHRGAVLASLFWLWFFAYGHWHRWCAPNDVGSEIAAGIIYLVLLVILVLLVCLRRSYAHPSAAFQWIAVGLVALQALSIARFELGVLQDRQVRVSASSGAGSGSRVRVHATVAPAERPHIFFLVLDGYARSDVMADIYGYDNRPFLASLRRHGFQIAAYGRTNYCQTMLSLPSCFNLDYLDALAAQLGPNRADRRPLATLLRENRTRAFLDEQGYDFVAFPTGFEDTQLPEAAVHLTRRWGGLTDFQSALLENTVLWPLLRSRLAVTLSTDHSRARLVLYAYDHLPAVARSRRPTFVFAHVISPHPPFIFLRDGSMVQNLQHPGLHDGDRFTGTPEEYLRLYREQAEFITRRTEAMIADLLASARRPTAVVLMCDHGPGSHMQWQHPSEVGLHERFAAFVAVRLPEGKTARLDDSISTVNVMRFVLSECLGADLPPLPTRSYFSPYERPYRFTWIAGADGRFHPNAHLAGPLR